MLTKITKAERVELAEDIDTIVAYLEAAVAELADKIHDTCRVGNNRKRATISRTERMLTGVHIPQSCTKLG